MGRNLTETVRNYKQYLKLEPVLFPIAHSSPLKGRWLVEDDWFEKNVLSEPEKIVRGAIGRQDELRINKLQN